MAEITFAKASERPRHTIVSARFSPTAELARWLFERYRIPYHEEFHPPVMHAIATRRWGPGVELAAVIQPEGVWHGALELLRGLDAKSRPGQRLFGESDPERAENRTMVETLVGLLDQQVPRLVCYHLLSRKEIFAAAAVDGAPAWERAFVRWLYPYRTRLVARSLDLAPARIAEAPVAIRAAFGLAEDELARRGTRFIGGDQPDTADIVLSALTAPVLLPPGYRGKLPSLEQLPAEYRALVDELRGRRGGRLVLDTYESARPEPQPPLPARRPSGVLSALLLGPTLQRWAAQLAARFGKVIRVRDLVVASRWRDVEEVLRRDLDFRIAPINGPRIDEVNGPFVLGIDRGERMAAERPQLYAAVSPIDLDAVRTLVATEAERLLDAAMAAGGKLDIVNGYARLVAARTAFFLFGVAGPTEAELLRVTRAVFQHTFLNIGGERPVAERALGAAEELRRWLAEEIARRQARATWVDDVPGRLLARRTTDSQALDDDGVRRNVAGLLVGAIDTTATAVGKVVAIAAANRALLARIERDVDDRGRMAGWCREALRQWTHNPVLLRRAAVATTLGGRAVPAGATVIAYTQAAMFDAGRFTAPGQLDPKRPAELYRHFGGGLHPCAGRAVNDVQVPELVQRVVRRGIAAVGRPDYEGPFLDALVVTLRGSM
jgi:cytochrome P450